MESKLLLGNVASPLPVLVSYTSAVNSARKTELHFSHCYHISQSHSLNASQCRPLRKAVLRPLIRALDRSSAVPSRNDRNIGNKIAVQASVALACVLGIIGASLKMSNNKAIAGPREKFQKAPQVMSSAVAYPLGAKYPLKSLLDVNVYLSSSKIDPPRPPSKLPPRPSAEDVNVIKMDAMRLMKNGRPEEAVSLLEKAYKSHENDSEPAYYLGMVLIEILICQGKYEEAQQYCNCFGDEQFLPSDGRLTLYKAIIHTMLDQKEQAKIWWEKYVETVDADSFDPRNL